jgi:filamentous hemagglutinin family protein
MKIKFCLFFITLASLVSICQTVIAQTYQPTNRTPVSDNTLGTQVTGSGNNFTITGGLNKGQTLFHSFTDFSVPTNGQANFINPVGNRDIITRVTGTVFSDINGSVNTNGSNFFLINPNGIIFGTGAQLNVGKAFVGSTANGINLVDGSGKIITFGANPNGDAPLLSIAADVQFNVSSLNLIANNSSIRNFGTLQTNNNAQYIGLIGGNVTIDGSDGGGKIIAPGGRIDITGMNNIGTFTIDNNGSSFSSVGVNSGDVLLTNGATISVRANQSLEPVNTFFNNATSPGSSINISASNIDIINSGSKFSDKPAAIDAGLSLNSGVQTTATGDIKLDATGKINLNNSDIKNTLQSGSEGSIGDIKIQAGSVDIQNSATISSITVGKGNAGNIDIKTTGDLTIYGTSDASLLQGNLTTFLSKINTSTDGTGDAGKIEIASQGNVVLVNRAGILSEISEQANGNSQGINITAKDVSLTNLSRIRANNYGGTGNSGNVDIKTTGNLTITGTNIQSLLQGDNTEILSGIASFNNGIGNTGKITINSQGDVLLANRGGIYSSILEFGIGDSQGINITAKDLNLTNISSIQSGNYKGVGNAGDIAIRTTGNITISGTTESSLLQGNDSSALSQISSATFGIGNTGNIIINTPGNLSVENRASIDSSIGTTGIGNGRGISIDARSIELNNYGLINSATLQTESIDGTSRAGNITLNAKGSISVNKSFITTIGFFTQAGNISISSDKILLDDSLVLSSGGQLGTGGNVNISTIDKILMQNNSAINAASASTDPNGNGGNITIDSPLIIALPGNNNITANATNGTGGTVNIVSQGLLDIKYRAIGSNLTNDITSSSTYGQSGIVNIDTPGTDPGKDSIELPNTATDASNQISQVCSANNRQNKLTVTGRGGLPPNANDLLLSDVVWHDPRDVTTQPKVGSANDRNPVKLVPPAVGWIFDGKGKVTLIAAESQGQPIGSSAVCPTDRKH